MHACQWKDITLYITLGVMHQAGILVSLLAIILVSRSPGQPEHTSKLLGQISGSAPLLQVLLKHEKGLPHIVPDIHAH